MATIRSGPLSVLAGLSIQQMAAAILLAVATTVIGHLIAFGIANLGEVVGGHRTANVMYSMGEGLMASVCLGLFLMRLRASTAARVWCWAAAFTLWVGAMPAWGIVLGEGVLMTLILMLLAVSFLMWLVWLPWWRPSWVSPASAVAIIAE